MTHVDVLHLTRDLPPATKGGLSIAVHAIASAQAAAGRAVAVLSFDGWRPRARPTSAAPPLAPRAEGPLHVLRVHTPADLPAAAAFIRVVAPAALHVHDALLWPPAAAARAALGVPAVFHLHVLHAAQNAARQITAPTLGLTAEDAALAAADRVIAPSRAVRDLVLARAPRLADRLSVVPLALHPPPSPLAPSPPRDPGLIVFAGRFDAIKGFPELLDALVLLLADHPERRAVLAGGLPDNPRGERRWRRRWLATAPPDVAARVAFPGWLDPAVVADLHRRAAVVLAPSRFETFGLGVLEAMAHGAPLVVTDAGGLPELVGDTARIVPAGDVAALVAAAADLLTDPAAPALGALASARARRLTADSDVVVALDAIYRR